VEWLLEAGSCKLSSVVRNLFGASRRCILAAIAAGQTGAAALARFCDAKLEVRPADLVEAFRADWRPEHRLLLE